MTKSIAHLFFAGVLFTGCTKEPGNEIAEVAPVNKKMIFQVFAGKDYSATTYDNTQTNLTLNIVSINLKTGATTQLWDTTLNGDLRSFPPATQKIQFEKVFGVKENESQLHVAYSVRYNQNGLIQQTAKFESIAKGVNIFLQTVDL
jgi:hypothetical protein